MVPPPRPGAVGAAKGGMPMLFRSRPFARLAAFALVAGAVGPAHALLHDHYECYKIKDASSHSAAVNLTPTLDSPFDPDSGCTVKVRSKQICFPVNKDVVTSDAPHKNISGPELAGPMLCYAVKCPASSVPDSLEMTDQFGTHTVSGFRVTTICTPTVYGTPATTTTTLPSGGIPKPCTSATTPACDGTCSDFNNSCRPDAGGTACTCVFVDNFGPCPQADGGPPNCWGSCQGDQTCIEVGGACQCGLVFE
jgi:hypothetical protein